MGLAGSGAMGLSATSELALDLGPPSSSPASARAVAGFLRQAAASGEGRPAIARLEEYVRGLEEERRKIEGFRRELPLCILVLNDVIEALKEELRRSGGRGRPVLEEFMPVTRKSDEEDGGVKQESNNDRDKVNWMSSVQLWSDNSSTNTSSTASITVATATNAGSSASSRKNTNERAEDDHRRTREDENPFGDSRCRNGGGAFLAFKGLPSTYQGGRPRKEKVEVEVVPLPDLSLLSPATKASRAAASPLAEDRWSGWSSSRGAGAAAGREEVSLQTLPSAAQQQPPRKARRCWSPELHRRFVDALQHLGGAQVATPKQIREMMKVDDLTNDEVKSHLQYRLHTRKVPGAPNPANQQVVMFGGLWLSQDGTSPSGSPQGPLQLTTAAQRMAMVGGDSCEEEDGKSESYTWKGHVQSGEETD